jgi:hypothetical protein
MKEATTRLVRGWFDCHSMAKARKRGFRSRRTIADSLSRCQSLSTASSPGTNTSGVLDVGSRVRLADRCYENAWSILQFSGRKPNRRCLLPCAVW